MAYFYWCKIIRERLLRSFCMERQSMLWPLFFFFFFFFRQSRCGWSKKETKSLKRFCLVDSICSSLILASALEWVFEVEAQLSLSTMTFKIYIYIYIYIYLYIFEAWIWFSSLNFLNLWPLFFFLESFNIWCLFLIIAIYYQIKTSISFWCR